MSVILVSCMVYTSKTYQFFSNFELCCINCQRTKPILNQPQQKSIILIIIKVVLFPYEGVASTISPNKMQSAKEKVKDMSSAAKEKMQELNVAGQEKAEKAGARNKHEKEIAEERAKIKKHQAKAELHQDKAQHQAEAAGHADIHHAPLTGTHGRQPMGATPGPTAAPTYPASGVAYPDAKKY